MSPNLAEFARLSQHGDGNKFVDTAPTYTLFVGTFIHLPRIPVDSSADGAGKHVLEINRGAVWVSIADGRIKGMDWAVKDDGTLVDLLDRHKWVIDDGKDRPCPSLAERVKVVRAREERNEFFFPGFVDTHIHASQYPNNGLFGSSTLLDWLQTYTFPIEKSYGYPADFKNNDLVPEKAKANYNQVVSRTLFHGTTCAAYYATIHVPATNYLASLCYGRGQRALIGRVCMDREGICPEDYRDYRDSVGATAETIEHILSIDPAGDLVKPVVSPRFAPACTEEVLSGLGELARSHDPPLHIQTHIAENKQEVELVQDTLFPDYASYTHVYDKACLLTPRTILAHGVYLSELEREVIRARQSKVSHCPVSNSALGSGMCPVRKLLDSGITVGLGTDVSGGYSPSILEAVRQACLVSRLLAATTTQQGAPGSHEREKLSVEEALYLGTRGGAEVVDMANDIGGFEVGMSFDAQLIELGAVTLDAVSLFPLSGSRDTVSNVDIFGSECWTEKVHKWVWNGDDRNVRMVWVRGRLVHIRPGCTEY